MFERFKKLFRPKGPRYTYDERWMPYCKHDQNYNMERYTNEHGCPMVRFMCLDCGKSDDGPVIMGKVPKDWYELKIVRRGKEIK